MASLAQIRQQYPEYSDLSDQELADGLYGAFYSDMDRAEYDRSIGFAPQPAPPADVAPPPMLTSQMDPNPVLRAILGVDAPTPGMPGAMPAPTLTPPAPLPPDDLGLALDAYERKGLGEVTGERLRGGVLDVAAGQDMVGAAREADALATLDQARALLAAGAGVEEFAKLAEGQTRFPLNTLMDAGAVERAAALFEKRLPASVNRGVERQAEAAAVPRNPVLGAVIEAGNENGMFSREVLDTIMRDPLGVLGEAGVRSLPQSVAPIIGGLTMGPAGSALGSVAMTGGEGITSALQHYGVDVRDPAAVEAALRDPAMRTKVQEFTNARQAPIAAADMLTMGLASALAGRPLTNILSQLIVEPAGEMAGEAGAQLASTGEVDQGEVLAEGLGGVASGGAQATATSLMETIRQALSAPAQPQSAPPVPMSAPGAPDAPAAPVAAPAASPQPVRPTAPQPGKEPSNLFNDYVTGRTLRLYSGRVQGEPVTVTGMTADGITIQRQNGETDSIPASDLRDGFATLIDERGEIVRPTDAPAPPAAKPAPKRAGPADLSGVSDDTIANVGNAIFDSGLSNPEGAARVLMLPKEAEELRAAGIEISEEGVVSQDDIRALVEERESRGARRRPAPVQETTPRVPSPEEEAEATRIERAAARIPSAQVTTWIASMPSDRRAASSAARPATGIDPDGPVGRELKANNVTPQRFPRLFQRGGRQDLDNIPYSELPEGFDQILKADEAGYVDRQDLIDAIIAEANKTPRLTSEQSELRRQAEAVARRYEPDYDAPALPDAPAPVPVGRYVVSDPNTDLAPPAERYAEVSRVVDDLLANEYPDVRLDPRERAQIEDNLFRRGGDADDAFNWWLIQEDQYVRAEDPQAYQPIPFDIGDAPVLASEDPVLGRGSPDAAQPDAGADQPRAPGAGDTGRAEPGGGLQGPDDARPGPGAARTGTAEGGRVDRGDQPPRKAPLGASDDFIARSASRTTPPSREGLNENIGLSPSEIIDLRKRIEKAGGGSPAIPAVTMELKAEFDRLSEGAKKSDPKLYSSMARKYWTKLKVLQDLDAIVRVNVNKRNLRKGGLRGFGKIPPAMLDFVEDLKGRFLPDVEINLINANYLGESFEKDEQMFGIGGFDTSGTFLATALGGTSSDGTFVFSIVFKEGAFKSKLSLMEAIGHEFGHLLMWVRFNTLEIEERAEVISQWSRGLALSEQPVVSLMRQRPLNMGRQDQRNLRIDLAGNNENIPFGFAAQYAQSFTEWFADQVSRAVTTDARAVTFVEKFFARIARAWKVIAGKLRAAGYVSKPINDWLQSIDLALRSPFATEHTPEGQQLVIPGAEQITDKQRAERKMEQPKRGGDAPPPDGGLFSPKGPELFDERTGDGFSLSDAAAPKKPKPKSTGRQPKGSLTPSFLSMSFTDKNSVYEAAFRAAGIEPDKARLLPAARQIAILSKLLEDTYGVKIELPQITTQRKTVSGRKVEEKRPQISDRDAIDQMLDAFRQMQMMAHILGLPVGAVGLREGGVTGKGLILSLTRRLKGALGMYSYEPEGGARKITLPGRSNSFGHEWGHALDHFVHALFKGDWSKMLSRDIFKTGVTPASKSNQIAQAFTGVLQAMYGERAAMAALQIDLTLQAAQLNKKGEQTAAAKKAQGYLNMIEAGAKLPPDAWSGYFTTSAQFDEAFGGGGYFTDPAEMFARAFEAYLGTKAAAISGLPTSFLSKPDWAYNDSDETRASLTFPRGTDQIRVFAAIDRLMDEIREHGVFGEGRATKPEDADVYQSRVWDKMQPEGSMVEQERAARRRAKRTAAAIERTHPLWKQGRDFVSFMTDTFGGFLHGLINRQPPQAQAALRNMVDLFVTDPGSGRLIKPVWEAAVQIITTRHVNRLENMVAAHKLEEYTEAETAQLRQVLTGAKIKVDPKIEKAAADLRRMMDELWRYLTEAGVKIGYARNGYLPRIMDRDAVMVNQAGFKAQAAKVYATMFRRDVRTAEMEDQITDVRMLLRQINADTEGTETGDRVATARLDPSDIDLIDNWKKALTKLNRLEKQAADLAKKGEEDKADALSEKIGEAREAFETLHADMLDMLERQWSAYAADKWLVGVLAKSAMDIGGNAPASGFTKKRELPAEADKLMADFYQGNPVTLIHDFIGAAARRAEWTRRVGENGEKLNNMVEAAIKAGADSRDVEEIRHSINVLAGRVSNNGESFVHTVYGWFYTFTTMFLLKLAPLASLAEPMVAGLKTGRMRDSIRGLGLLLSQARKTGSAQDRRELARVIGLTRSAMNETVLQNRYGGELDPSQTQARLMSSFFQSIGLTGLTNASRHAMLPIGADHIRRMLMIDAGRRKGFFEVNAKIANEELNDLGIPKEHREALLDWLDSMDGRLPTVEDLIGVDGDYFNPAAAIWGPAMLQFVDTAIQNTRKFDRPGAALRPGMGLIYGITGFIFSFHRNVLGRMLKQGVDARRPGEGRARATVRQAAGAARNVARYTPAIGALVLGHTLVSIFRDFLFAPDGWEDAEEEDELTEWLLTRAWSRTGLMGAWDIPYNLITGLRYDRDLASAGVGPHIGVPLQAAQKFGNIWFGRNADGTNNTENRGVDALASLVLTGFGNMAISAIPGGPLTTAGKGAAIHGWTYLDPGQLVADALFPLDE